MLARTDETATESDAQQLSNAITLDETFDVLRNVRRRYVLRAIAEHDGPIPFGDLVDLVAARENDAEIGAVDSGTRKAVYTSLYQSHLPKLDDMGVVVHDRGSGPVRAGPHLDEVLDCLDAVEGARAVRSDDDQEKGWTSIRAAVGL